MYNIIYILFFDFHVFTCNPIHILKAQYTTVTLSFPRQLCDAHLLSTAVHEVCPPTKFLPTLHLSSPSLLYGTHREEPPLQEHRLPPEPVALQGAGCPKSLALRN